MKNQFILLAIILASFQLACKKTGLKDLDVRATYVHVPDVPLDTAINTYEVGFDQFASGSFSSGINMNSLIYDVKLNGFKKVSFGGDMQISLGIGDGFFNDRGIQSRKNKDKDGKEYITYYRQLEYGNQVFYRLIDRNRRTLDQVEVISRNRTNTFNTSDFTTADACNKWWQANINNKIDELRRDMIRNAVSGINTSLNNRYAWFDTNSKVEFKTVKDKKSRTYNRWVANDAKVQEAFRTMTSYSTTEYERRILPCIDFWLNEYEQIRGNDEPAEYLRHACLYNVATAYYWMDDFNNALKYINQGVALSQGSSTMKSLRNTVEDTQLRLERAGLTRQHIPMRKTPFGA